MVYNFYFSHASIIVSFSCRNVFKRGYAMKSFAAVKGAIARIEQLCVDDAHMRNVVLNLWFYSNNSVEDCINMVEKRLLILNRQMEFQPACNRHYRVAYVTRPFQG